MSLPAIPRRRLAPPGLLMSGLVSSLMCTVVSCAASPVFAQSAAGSAVVPVTPSRALEPPVPRPVVTALTTSDPIHLDGRLEEAAWQAAPVAEHFRSVWPEIGVPARSRTSVRVLSTPHALYIGAMLYDSLGRAGQRVQDLRRDFDRLQNDFFQVVLDPLRDTRTAVSFQVTPEGSLRDLQAFDGGDVTNENWDGVWQARTAANDSGWTVEIEIPWSTLRYAQDGRPWGVNFSRHTRRTLEISGLVPWPRQFSIYRMTFAADLVGLTPPASSRRMRVRPFVLGDLSRQPDRATLGRPYGRVGGELLMAPSASSLLELTANTDFAQADADRQVINLRRFSVFFPERRQFFLENTDVLSPSGVGGEYVVQPFFSRRIGLANDGTLLPIRGGARYSWRSGRASAGTLLIRQGETDAHPAGTFAVVRGSRFLRGATRVGAFAAIRADDAIGSGTNRRAGTTNIVTAVDAITRVGENVQLKGMLSSSTQDNTTGVAATWLVSRETSGLYTGLLGALVTEDYAPRTGFVSRSNVLLTSPAIIGTVRPAWRPRSIVWFKPALISYLYQTPGTGTLQEGYVQTYVDVLHANGALWYPYVERHFQRPTSPVTLQPGVEIPAGSHDYTRYGLYASSDRSARVSMSVNASGGSFFDGALTRVSGGVRAAPSAKVALSVDAEVNRMSHIGSRDTTVTSTLMAPELRVFVTPRLQLSTFYQHNTSARQGSLNARVSWEFQPLSYVYFVYNERRPIDGANLPVNQQLVMKVVWLR